MIRLLTSSAGETRDMAGAVAGLVRAGDVVLLIGDLGTGKTTFAQGFGRGLGVTEPITSPTFVLVRSYKGRLDLLHADVYRLDRLQEVIDLGLPELLDEGGVALVEWGDVAAPALAPDFLEVCIHHAGGDERSIELHPVGRSWLERWVGVELAVDRWRAPGTRGLPGPGPGHLPGTPPPGPDPGPDPGESPR